MSLSPDALKVVDDFSNEPGVAQPHVDRLKQLFADSPELARQLNEAVSQKQVTSFKPLTEPHAGGSFDPVGHSIQLPLTKLVSPTGVAAQSAGDLTFVLGHELQHSAFSSNAEAARQQFMTEARTIARTTHDYTSAAQNVISGNREDESRAEIAGWNATLSRVRAVHRSDTGRCLPRGSRKDARLHRYRCRKPRPRVHHEAQSVSQPRSDHASDADKHRSDGCQLF